jgi:hypothetical protein
MSPQRIQRKRTKGWWMPEGAVYVGRGSRWGNPFHVHKGHTLVGPEWLEVRSNWGRVTARAATCAYISSSEVIGPRRLVSNFGSLMYIRGRDEAEQLEAWLSPLRGKDLACWCPLDQPCHADVLLELANAQVKP